MSSSVVVPATLNVTVYFRTEPQHFDFVKLMGALNPVSHVNYCVTLPGKGVMSIEGKIGDTPVAVSLRIKFITEPLP